MLKASKLLACAGVHPSVLGNLCPSVSHHHCLNLFLSRLRLAMA